MGSAAVGGRSGGTGAREASYGKSEAEGFPNELAPTKKGSARRLREEPRLGLRLLVCDPEPLLVRGLATALREELPEAKVVGCILDREDVAQATRQFQPDVVLVSTTHRTWYCCEVASQIRTVCPSASIVLFAADIGNIDIAALLEIGAAGYLTTGADIADVVKIIKIIDSGYFVIHRSLFTLFLGGFQNGPRTVDSATRENAGLPSEWRDE
ncbi:MAG: hypothetical protein ACRDJ4_00840 [Actinomycetota bacterium]